MELSLSRREALKALLGLPLAAALPGCEEPAHHIDGALLGPSMELGHRLRDGLSLDIFRGAPTTTTELVIVGAGASGLAAAYRARQLGVEDLRVLELEAREGGTASAGHSAVTPYPWGAHYLPLPRADNEPLVALLHELGAIEGFDAEGQPIGAERALVREPESRVFYRGYWYEGLYPHAGSSPDEARQLARFRALLDGFAGLRDGEGRRAFTLPSRKASTDASLYALDRLTATEWLAREGLSSPRLAFLVDYACRDDYGLAAAHTSAYAALFYWVARMSGPGADTQPLLSWPQGNAKLIEHLARPLGHRLEPGRLVAAVTPTDDGVEVLALDARDHRPRRYLARRAIVATPRFIASRIVRARAGAPLIDAEHFVYGPWMVANLHVDGRPRGRGFEPAWDNVLADGPSLGYVTATHQSGADHGPSVLTYYRPFAGDDAKAERRLLASASYEELRDATLLDLERAHPGLRSIVRRLDVFRWGHAMAQPRPGFLSSGTLQRAREPLGTVHFAGTDLSGFALFEEAFDQGLRAAEEAAAALRPSPT